MRLHDTDFDNDPVGAYGRGTDCKQLRGIWLTTWYVTDEDGRTSRYRVCKSLRNDEFIEYPQEKIRVFSNGSSFVGRILRIRWIWSRHYWVAGRRTTANDLTLLYWSSSGSMCGVIFFEDLKINYKSDSHMKGSWMGRTRDSNVAVGKVEWLRCPADKSSRRRSRDNKT